MFQGVGMVGPVVALAGRARLRGWRMPVLIAVTAMLTIGCLLCALTLTQPYLMRPDNARGFERVGYFFVLGFFGLQYLLTYLLVPALAGNALAGDRAPSMWDCLRLTRLPAVSLLLGKLIVALLPFLYALLAALPALAVCLLLGGVSPGQLAWGSAAILAQTLAVGCVGLYSAARFRAPGAAITMSYVLMLLLFCYPYVAYVLVGTVCIHGPNVPPVEPFILIPWAPYVLLPLCTLATRFFRNARKNTFTVMHPIEYLTGYGCMLLLALALCTIAFVALLVPLALLGHFIGTTFHLDREKTFIGVALVTLLTNNAAGLAGAFTPWELLGLGSASIPRWVDLGLAPATILFHLLVALAALWRATARLKTQLQATP